MRLAGPWKIRRIDTRPQQRLRGFELTHGRAKAASEFLFVRGRPVGQGVVCAVPHILRRVEFRGVGWKVFGVDPGMTMEKVLDQLAAMNRAAIPQENKGAAQMMEQVCEKL